MFYLLGMQDSPRRLVLLGVKVPKELAQAVRRAAREDDRSVSAVVRRLLAAALLPQATVLPASDGERDV